MLRFCNTATGEDLALFALPAQLAVRIITHHPEYSRLKEERKEARESATAAPAAPASVFVPAAAASSINGSAQEDEEEDLQVPV